MLKPVINIKVRDFNTWKTGFDNNSDLRKRYGGSNCRVNTLHGNPNDVYVICDWDKKENFDSFVKSKELAEAMKQGGVISEPKVTILDEVKRG
jgi:hypothetical protein